MKRLFPFLFLSVGIALTAWSFLHIMDARASTHWPKVEGEVISSVVKEQLRPKPNQTEGRRMLYQPQVTYRFNVDETNYEADKISFGEGASLAKGPARKIQSKSPVGKSVIVFVNSANPKHSVLEPGMT